MDIGVVVFAQAANQASLGVAMPSDAPQPAVLAAALAGRLIHDVMGPLSGVISGLDLLGDPTARDLHVDALALATASARTLCEDMAFSRVLYGAGAAPMDAASLEGLARGQFVGGRATLDWSMDLAAVSATAGRTLLGFVRLAAAALAAGGVVKVNARAASPGVVLSVEATGPRARFFAETLTGLAGAPFSEGLIGKWAPAYQLWAAATSSGGTLSTKVSETGVVLEARFPG